MNKIKLTLLLVLGVNFLNAQNTLVKIWDFRFGGTDVDWLIQSQHTIDQGYVLGGYSFSESSGDKTQDVWGNDDYWIVKIDSLGNKQWDRDFGGTGDEVFYSLQQTSDKGFIIGGFSISDSSGDKTQNSWGYEDFWIVKTDSLGNKQWDKDYGGVYGDRLHGLQQTTDGGYILGGYSNSIIGGDKTQPTWGFNDYWIVKIDSIGNKQWDKDYGGTDFDYLYSLQQTTDGGYILGGYSSSGIGGDKTHASWGAEDYWIVKIDSLGNKLWDKVFGGTNSDLLFSLQQTSDGGYILGGYSSSGINGDKTQNTWGLSDYWIVKIDSLGNKQWDRDFGGTSYEELDKISETSDGGYLLSGNSFSNISGDKTENNLGAQQTWVVKIDSFGNKQWDKTVNSISQDQKGLAMQVNNACFLITNSSQSGIGGDKTQSSQGNYDYWLIKYCDSTLSIGVDIPGSILKFSIYPNPFNSKVKLEIQNHNLKQATISIRNVFGQIVYSYLENYINTIYIKEIDLSFLANGIYLFEIISDGRRSFQKVIKN
ncbi:MAG: T9SS type A sorting domain-containing protein [Bacteroidetes bacterium]|nr:T9SS type A sorting domain-containing protein [Bacteroidota bacterium]MBL0074017.1 T9SS type A sorting domain-containing protein [Bacteroidota bacterium]